jgi:endonuclease/exonuclease/phosphatase family metal-dependent hydrolase
VPATGGWQNWTTVTVPVTLAGGTQVMTVAFDTSGVNLRYVKAAVSSSVTPNPPAPTPTPPASTGAYSGTPVSVPGRVEAANFDNGGEGVGYHDTTSGNSGGQYRSTDVDIEASSEGGYDVGWTAAGEWLNYTVNVASAGTYTAQLRVASPNGGSMHVGFNSASNVWTMFSIPATGGWQSWTTVSVPVTLGAGVQQMTLMFDTGGINLGYVDVASGSTPTPTPTPPTPPPPSSGGAEVIVAEWNMQVDDSSSAHARTVIDYLAALSPQPQVIVLLEARGTQYNTYLNELQNRTSYTWHGAFLSECPPGAWSGSSCTTSEDEGTAVLSSLPVVGSSATYLPYADAWHSARALVRLAVSVNGTTVQVMGTHLQVSNATARYNSMAYLKNWASNFPAPQLVAGDFNADPDQIDVGMLPNFTDSWFAVNATRGLTCTTPSPTMKLDYWFADASGRATPRWSSVVLDTGTVSDHFPLHAAFMVR